MSRRAPLTIETMVRDPDWLADKDASVTQMAILKGFYGLPLSKEEMEAFLVLTEGRRPRKGGYRELTGICGVRSGKTEKIAGNIALFECITFDATQLSPGEFGYFFYLAQSLDASMSARAYLEGKALLLESKGWDILDHGKAQERAITGKYVRFLRNVIAQCFPATKASTRGKTGIGYVLDEVAYWHTAEEHYNPDTEVYRAVRSRLGTIPTARGVVITSPFGEEGLAWNHWQERKTSRRLTFCAPSWLMNPSLDEKFLAGEQEADPEGYLREYGAQFGKTGGAYLPASLVDSALRADRPAVLEPKPGVQYFAQVDLGFVHDLYAFGIAHEDAGRCIVDLVKVWRGTKKSPVNEEAVTEEIAADLRHYGLDSVVGDQYAAVPTQNEYRKNGITFRAEADTGETNHEMFRNLKVCLTRSLVDIPKATAQGDDKVIRQDLLSLVAKLKGNGALIRVAAPRKAGFHDDVSKVIAALVKRIIPTGGPIDIAALNAGAVRRTRQEYIDWRRPERESGEAGGALEIGNLIDMGAIL